MLKMIDLEETEKNFRAATPPFNPDWPDDIKLQMRGVDCELAFVMWRAAEHNRDTDMIQFTEAFGAIVGSCIRNHIADNKLDDQARLMGAFLSVLVAVINGEGVVIGASEYVVHDQAFS